MGTRTRPGAGPRLGVRGWLRWGWRQLTSMRTALLLLLLVAVAAVPGSVFPQRNIDATAVSTFLEENPGVGPWLDRFGLFDVYLSPWFSAIYLLLVVSLIGCIVPRTFAHWQAARAAPPRAPRHLTRLPVRHVFEVDGEAGEVTARARALLRGRRYRVRADDGSGPQDGRRVLSAETGYLRETGNLLFHIAIVVVIVALAVGYLFGWKADRIVPVGQSFANSLSSYDTFAPGPWVDPAGLVPFRVRVDAMRVRFDEQGSGAQFGAARDFAVETTVTPTPGAAPEHRLLGVNNPLQIGDASVYLLGNGYAPHVTVRGPDGTVLYEQATPFLPRDGVYTSTGAIKVTGAQPHQLGFAGVFLPTAALGDDGPVSLFPDARAPALVLSAYEGELFSGGAQSVYSLDTQNMKPITGTDGQPVRIWLTPGATVDLPGGRGSISLGEIDRWAGVSTRHDPGQGLALGSSLVALLGLVASLLVKRRRVFVAVTPAGAGRSRVEVAGMARGEDPTLAAGVAAIAAALGGPGPAAAGGRPDPEQEPSPAPKLGGQARAGGPTPDLRAGSAAPAGRSGERQAGDDG